MTRTTLKFLEILDAYEFVSFGQPMEHEAYICLETGEIYWHSAHIDDEKPLPEDIEDTGKYISIPRKNDLDLGKALVLKYADMYLPESYYKVREIFNRSGAYARFEDLLEYRGMLQHWYDYEEKAILEALRRWCNSNNINIDG